MEARSGGGGPAGDNIAGVTGSSARRLVSVSFRLVGFLAWGLLAATGVQAGSLWFPQFVNGEAGGKPNRTRIVLMNPGYQPVEGRIRFRSPEGVALRVPFAGEERGEVSFTIPPRGTFQSASDGTGPLLVGSAEVETLGPTAVNGVLVYELLGHLVSVASQPPVASVRLPVTVDEEESTGIALFNPDSRDTARVRARLLAETGLPQAEKVLDPLAPQHQRSCFVSGGCLFADFFRQRTGRFEGTLELEVEAGPPLAILGLVQRRDGALMALPAGAAFWRASGTWTVSPGGTPVLWRGLNLGGWLVPEGYILHLPGYGSPSSIRAQFVEVAGEQAAAEFWDLYRANYVREEDIERIAAWGFNSVRLPFHYLDLWDPDRREFREEGFLRFHRLLDWCRRHGLAVILDLHCAPGGQNPNNISDSDGVARLWLDPAHQELTVQLWKELARRLADDPAVAGYDLLNEPVLPGGMNPGVLRSLYERIAAAIREVDARHPIIVEGNWYATDLSGLTPPFDDNLIYSFHKYWDAPTAASLERFLDLRSRYGVPLWAGEFGENSNPWAMAVIREFERQGIGWCWWTHKKLETITSPLSAPIPPAYQRLLDFWEGQRPKPTPEEARQGLMELAHVLALPATEIHRDVLHALLDPQHGAVTRPFQPHVAGRVIQAADYDLGGQGYAYFDRRAMRDSYSDSSPWNSGWRYRNDGVDIEACQDAGSPWNVGWIENGEWLQFTVEVPAAGIHDLEFRTATPQSGGRLNIRIDGVQVLPAPLAVPPTGNWQVWTSVRARGLSLAQGTHVLRVEFPVGGFNLSRLQLIPR